MNKKKYKRRKPDPVLTEMLKGAMIHGPWKEAEWFSSNEAADRLIKMGYPAIDPPILGAYLTADHFRKKRFWVRRTCFLQHPEAMEDYEWPTDRPINKWSIIFCENH